MPITYAVVVAADTTPMPTYGATASGYGAKIPTRYRVKVAADTSRWRRVYAACYGNAASVYVIVNGAEHYLDDHEIAAAL